VRGSLGSFAEGAGVEGSYRFAREDDRKIEALAVHDDEATFKHIQPFGANSRFCDGTAISATLQEPCSADGEED
jgi:hypothetical protein